MIVAEPIAELADRRSVPGINFDFGSNRFCEPAIEQYLHCSLLHGGVAKRFRRVNLS